MICVSEFFEAYRILKQPAHERHDPHIAQNAVQRLQHLRIRVLPLELARLQHNYAAQQQAEQGEQRETHVSHLQNRFHVGILRFLPAQSM